VSRRGSAQVLHAPAPYNPLDKTNLGISVANALLTSDIHPLPPATPFVGAGIYAIYYTGGFEPYLPIASANRDGRYGQPIYVGKAIPKGARKGNVGVGENPGTVLFDRVREHARSIRDASNVELGDFACRYLVVDDIWIPLGESLLIGRFKPVWNVVLEGFGIHDPGGGRAEQARSSWDVIHPGRSFASDRPANRRIDAEILRAIRDFLSKVS
jgi:Eco29kI restriction endonuclease